jgi:hypothetical protein
MRGSTWRTAAGVAVIAVTVVVPAPAALAQATVNVPCDPTVLASDIVGAARGDTLSLAAGCIYRLTSPLPTLTQDLTILGDNSTLERSSGSRTPPFSMLSVTNGAISISDLNFRHGTNSYYPSAIVNSGGAVTVNGGTFSGNSGGAIDAGLGYFAINGATFTGNSAYEGGAIDVSGGVIHISSCVFNANSAVYGGAIFIEETTYATPGNAFVTDSRLIGNRASQWGGGIADPSVFDVLVMTGTQISHNHAGTYGGGLLNDGKATVSTTEFKANGAGQDGGAIWTSANNSFTLLDSLISRNYADGQGGGIENQGPTTVSGSTISHNTATGGGGGIEDTNAPYGNPASTTLTGSTVAKNTPDNCAPPGTIAGCTG